MTEQEQDSRWFALERTVSNLEFHENDLASPVRQTAYEADTNQIELF